VAEQAGCIHHDDVSPKTQAIHMPMPRKGRHDTGTGDECVAQGRSALDTSCIVVVAGTHEIGQDLFVQNQ
jgi:hypothetical protein